MFPRRAFAALLVACLLAASCAPAAVEPVTGRVIKVHDGDSITVESDGSRYKCRLLGIDTPELSNARLWTEMDKVSKYSLLEVRRELHAAREAFGKWAKVMEARAREARRALCRMVDGRMVRLAYDSKQPRRDRYGRLLVYVASGGFDVNAEMLRHGLAVAETRYPCDRLGQYVKLWRGAQAARVGLWAAPASAGHESGKVIRKEPASRPRPQQDEGPLSVSPCLFGGRSPHAGMGQLKLSASSQ